MANKNKKTDNYAVIAQNKKARHDYHIEETFEAGIVLTGTEVKSLRLNGGSIKESHAALKKGELFLFNAHIPEYSNAGTHLQHDPRRPRKLLLHNREIKKLIGLIQQKGYTLVALKLYFNAEGRIKLEIGLGKGKKLHDKRQTEKDRDWKREKARLLKQA